MLESGPPVPGSDLTDDRQGPAYGRRSTVEKYIPDSRHFGDSYLTPPFKRLIHFILIQADAARQLSLAHILRVQQLKNFFWVHRTRLRTLAIVAIANIA